MEVIISMSSFFGVVCVIALLAILLSIYNYMSVESVPEGTPEMKAIAMKIRNGANVFLKEEYKVLAVVVIVLFIVFSCFIYNLAGMAFAIGAIMSGLAGWYGMQMSVRANVRVTQTAKETNNIGTTLKVAFKGGSVMGLSVASFALLGLAIVMFMSKSLWEETNTITNWLGLTFNPLSIVLSSYGLGCSIIALFNRVGGGIYTKAADMGSDLVGKTELKLNEDDPRNPGVIADCVGDNVGDTAGLGSDLLESFAGAIVSSIVLAIHLFSSGLGFNIAMLYKLIVYPVAIAAFGLVACMVGIVYISKKPEENDPHRELNRATWISAGLTATFGLIVTIALLIGEDINGLPFKLGIFSPWVATIIGIAGGVVIGMVAEYYTSYDENGKTKPTNKIARVSKDGAALTITQGLAVGMNSTLLSVIILGAGLLISYAVAGVYGTALAAVGMLSFVAMTVSVDTYGPISDNAGGIAEMAKLDENVRKITDKLDSVGNTTAAIGKGFAIGSAAYATMSLMISYLYSFTPIGEEVSLDVMNPLILVGILVGSALVWRFSGMLIEAVSEAAGRMVDEIRRQFKEIEGLAEGKTDPDYNQCIGIATKGAIAEMRKPALISILVPIGSGLLLGTEFLGGILFGATISAILLAIFCGNAGGAWDNAKKGIEASGLKGTDIHCAAVVGDTVGDPLKDTVGPSLDINIKFMSMISLLGAPIFVKFNLLALFTSLLG